MNSRNGVRVAGDSAFLSGGGEMARLIGETDWSTTPLGPIDAWPQSLRTTVSLCLASNFPINIIWGPEHCQIYNDGYRVVCGAAHPQALGEPYTVTWASAWPAIGEPFHRALAGETSFLENQRMFLFRNGYLEETFFTFSLSPIRDESGGIGGLFHPVTETTASMLAERRARLLRDLNARLAEARTTRQVFDNILAIIAEHAFDLPFVLLYALDARDGSYRLAGSAGVAPDDPIAPAVLPEDAAAPWPVEALAMAREPIEVALPQPGHGAARGPYEESPSVALAFPIPAPDMARPQALLMVGASARLPLDEAYRGFLGLLASALGAGLASARGYEEARQRAEMLAALDQAKTAFFSNVSHEFRTPLTLMLGPIQDALEAGDDLPPAQRERLAVAHRNALRLLKLVNSLLDFSRVEAGRSRAAFQPTDLAGLTAELASNFRSACERAGLALVVDCPPLPEPVNVDREMWEKIVLNLLSNAFKFTLEGGIAVRLHRVDGRVELIVEDTGVGIADAELPRVFERFHRIEGQGGRTHEGSGIGLALVEELAKLHGGAVSVRSQLGEGSAFTVSLPLGAAHLPRDQVSNRETLSDASVHAEAFVAEAMRWLPDAEDAVPSDVPEAAEDFGGLVEGRPRVVLADDNADMRAYVKRLLEAGGYAVEAVSDGRAALEAALRGPPPDLVLSDVMMPGLDGFGLLAALRAETRLEGLLVILLSARAGEEARVEGLAAGADDYLVKPFSARELRARVDGAVRLARQRRQAARREQALRAEMIAERGRAALRQSQQQLEFALEAGRLGSWEMDVATRRITVSDHCRALFGLRPDDPFEHYDDVVARVHPEDRERRDREIQHAIASGEDLEVEYRIQSPDDGVRWVMARGRATYDQGRAVHIAGVTLDITERKAAEARQTLLLAEVDHRAKNTLASVQSIALQTLRYARDPTAFADTFQARIHALSRAHELLTASAWRGADLMDVIRRTLEVHLPAGEQERMVLTGPSVRLGPNAAVTVNMAFHELATNATKYGALTTADGRVEVAWALDGDTREIIIDWRETGGPAVAPPSRRGFGSRLLEQGLPRELGGGVDLRFLPEGLRCAIRLPLSAKVGLAET
ncbi:MULTISPECIES: ATP-binding protein [unclassified Caulobacter]|uniref:ATP-binding protein n=1 Tax=unclassified Caulobacter TaxID=2648921 RepID=UPI0006F9065C|nr:MULTISPECIES: ATP-binding protein [unclassified Caulobacter]KQV58564.1 PAS domain S-box protein [Caulobacter sp. Root342]KQV68927.1 PAS domain S-box protein [Caulobacter sp. Root343]